MPQQDPAPLTIETAAAALRGLTGPQLAGLLAAWAPAMHRRWRNPAEKTANRNAVVTMLAAGVFLAEIIEAAPEADAALTEGEVTRMVQALHLPQLPALVASSARLLAERWGSPALLVENLNAARVVALACQRLLQADDAGEDLVGEAPPLPAPEPTAPPFPEAVAALGRLAAAPHPDARLLALCDRLGELRDRQGAMRHRTYRGAAKALRAFLAEHAGEMNRLMAEIAELPALTDAGRRAKGELAAAFGPSAGIMGRFVASAFRDFLAQPIGGAA
ncbi:MAG: hypothetical protein K2X11_02555 [Acetobacteraceae bacterium]|nr:hypothetical protein [Acetobacteraceae bacterium]